MPQIGELGPGLWLASGFGGHGLNTTAMAGNLVARGIADDDPTWKRFAPFELVWAGGKYGRALAQMHYWIRRFGDAVAERRAQYGASGRHYRRLARQGVQAERSMADPLPPPRAETEDVWESDNAAPSAEVVPVSTDARPLEDNIEMLSAHDASPQPASSGSYDEDRAKSEEA